MESKPYVVIARKYRPQRFGELVGQEPISTTLKNAIALNRIGHAYLFTGPRGVGKTSMARIFAKALNCKNGPTTDPCGACQACVEIEGSRSLDVLEIDGASNRGIDEIRELRENVKFSPASGKFKIYIIDEVHQITTDGFNALLKTLEEPPAHVKFIFATTAAHKVPATILSRCQRFDFRRIPTDLVASTLKEIARKEKIKIEDGALAAIARAADGSLRDGQSILDQIASSTAEEKITQADVTKSLGALEEETLIELLDALAGQDAKGAVLILNAVLKEGKEPSLLAERLLEHVRNLLFVHVSESLAELVEAGDSYRNALLKQAGSFTKEDLFYFFSVLTHTLQTMKRFDRKRIPLEIALIKLARRESLTALSRLLEELKSPEKKTAESGPVVDAEPSETEELPTGEVTVAEGRAPQTKTASLEAVWQIFLRTVKNEKISVASYLAEAAPFGFENRIAKISFPERLAFFREALETEENKKLIERHLSSLLELDVRVEFLTVKEERREMGAAPSPDEARPADPVKGPSEEIMKAAKDIFGGKVIRSSGA